MKDLKYLLLIIGFVIFAHATRKHAEVTNEAKYLPDIPDFKLRKQTDSGRIEASNKRMIVPVVYYY